MSIRYSNANRVLSQGSNHGEIAKNNMTTMISNQFSSSPSYFEVRFNDDVELTGVHIIDDATSTNQTNHSSKYVVMQPNDNLKIGDVIEYQNNKWICVACEKFNDIYYKGKILKAEHSITLHQNSITYKYPIAIESSVQLYRLNQENTKFFTELSDIIVGRIQNNNITSLISIGDVYEIGKFRYKVTNISDVIETGFLIVKFQITTEHPEPIPESKPNQPIEIIGVGSIVKNKSEVYTVDVDYDVVFTLEGGLANIISQTNNSCTVQAGHELGYVTLIARSLDGLVESSKEIRIRNIF